MSEHATDTAEIRALSFVLHPGFGAAPAHWELLESDDPLMRRIIAEEIPKVGKGILGTGAILAESLPPAWAPGRFFAHVTDLQGFREWKEVTHLVAVAQEQGLALLPEAQRARARAIVAAEGT